MPEGYRHLTFDERCQIYATGKSGLSNGAIARQLGRHPATISREIRRDGGGRGYRQGQAWRKATERRSEASSVPRKLTEGRWAKVVAKLEEGWSPEQVSGRLRLEDPGMVGRQRIYDLVRADRRDGGTLFGHLRRRGKKPNWKGGRHAGRGQPNWKGGRHAGRGHIPGRRDISERPKEVGAKALEADFFFATPYHSWERGLNGHTNGLPPQYLPKGTDLRQVTDARVKRVQDILNARPRKALGYLTPAEAFARARPP